MKYFWLTVRHRWFVFRAGLRLGVPLWRLLIHDLSKFSPQELPHYNRQFFGNPTKPKSDPQGFAIAWLHHQNHNAHHWEYWMPRTGHNRGGVDAVNGCLPMPEWAVREMVADWLGAGRAYDGYWPQPLAWTWLEHARSKMMFHPNTELILDDVLKELRAER